MTQESVFRDIPLKRLQILRPFSENHHKERFYSHKLLERGRSSQTQLAKYEGKGPLCYEHDLLIFKLEVNNLPGTE